jgi:imidazolonepropionase-like amidohydrolase
MNLPGQILCGALITMDEPAPEGPQLIEVESGRIKSIRPAGNLGELDRSDLLDLSTLTVLPGFVDAHTHLDFDVLIGNENAQAAVPDHTLALRMANRGVINLQSGVTTVRLLGSRDFLDISVRECFDNNELPGPRIVTATRGITSSRSPHVNNAIADGPTAIRQAIRENIAGGAEFIKIFAGGSIGAGDDSTASIYCREELSVAVEEAHRFGRKIAAHAYGGQSVDDCLDFGVDYIEHGVMMTEEQYDRAADTGTWIIPTLRVFVAEPGISELPHWPDWLRQRLLEGRQEAWKSIEKLKASGAQYALATDAIHGELVEEAVVAASAGLTTLEALSAITCRAADVCELSDDTGRVKVGAFADLVAVEGNPLEDLRVLRDVKVVLKGGQIVTQPRENW